MRFTAYLFVILLFLTACSRKGNDIADEEIAPTDSVVLADTTDSVEVKEVPVPKAADLMFDDFIYNFMSNKSFQNSRVKFPLSYTAHGETRKIEKKQWTFDSIYANQDIFLMIFPNESALEKRNTEKTTSVEVQELDFTRNNIKQYNFNKDEGRWTLSSIQENHLDKAPNREFLQFYQKFASDSIYREQHIHNPFTLVFQDEDTFEPVQGIASPEQWCIYAPELPHKKITNVNYNQDIKDPTKVVLMIGTQNGSMSSILTFRQQNGEWKLIKLENN